jgi:hypothetical protein
MPAGFTTFAEVMDLAMMREEDAPKGMVLKDYY